MNTRIIMELTQKFREKGHNLVQARQRAVEHMAFVKECNKIRTSTRPMKDATC